MKRFESAGQRIDEAWGARKHRRRPAIIPPMNDRRDAVRAAPSILPMRIRRLFILSFMHRLPPKVLQSRPPIMFVQCTPPGTIVHTEYSWEFRGISVGAGCRRLGIACDLTEGPRGGCFFYDGTR